MGRLRKVVTLEAMAGLLLGSLGCQSYRYMREVTPEMEHGRKEYVVNNPGNRYNDDILMGRVRTGMSRLQVRITWGDPDHVDPGSAGTSEVWAYEETEPSRGTSIYRLRFEGEQLARLDVERATVEIPVRRDLKSPPDPVRSGSDSDSKPNPER